MRCFGLANESACAALFWTTAICKAACFSRRWQRCACHPSAWHVSLCRLAAAVNCTLMLLPLCSNEENVKLLKQDKTQNQAFLLKEFQIGEQHSH